MEKICSICQTSLSSEDSMKVCGHCKSEFHLDCWDENGGCATYGCINSPKAEKINEQFQEQTFWGVETKTCPMCGETIKVSELRCPYCNELFDTIVPITSQEIKDRITKRPQDSRENKGAILIFICGLLGITAPFNLFFGGIWYQQNRKKLKEASPTYNLLAIVGLSVSVIYSLLIVIGVFLY